MHPTLKPHETRFRIYSVEQKSTIFPEICIGGSVVTAKVMLWEEPPGWELEADFPTRASATDGTAQDIANQTGMTVVYGYVGLVGPTTFHPCAVIHPEKAEAVKTIGGLTLVEGGAK